MQMQINTNNSIDGHERLVEWLENAIRERLARFSDLITRVELHPSGVNADRAGNDKRCVIEVRPSGLDPVVTTDQSDSVEDAVSAAARKMGAALDSAFGKFGSR